MLFQKQYSLSLLPELEGEPVVLRAQAYDSLIVNPSRSSIEFHGKRLSSKSLRYMREEIRT